MYAAKWQFSPNGNTASCSDYVVFPVNKAGASGTQPNIVAYQNLYVNGTGTGFCPTLTAPTVLFSYFVGTGTVTTSPALGGAAGQVAYVESIAGGSKFHVLKGAGTGASNGTVAAPVAPGTGNTATDVSVTLNGGVMVTRSSPFYDYANDVAYVGDDTGNLHKFTPVFNGAPAEVISAGANVWPANVSTQVGKILTPPVFDNVSGLVFVGDSQGFLYSVSRTIGSGAGGVRQSNQLGNSASGIMDSPLLDPSAETLYVFVGDNVGGTGSAVFLFNAAVSIAGSSGTNVTVGTGSTTVPVYVGTFDNIYYTSPNGQQPAGSLYVCGDAGGNPTLYVIPITYSAGAQQLGAVVTGPALGSSNVGCSPLTEFYNTNTSVDWLFGSVVASSCGASASTAGGCVLAYNITAALSAATLGPWTPGTLYGANAQIVDTNGDIEQCTGSSCGVLGSQSGTSAPAWATTTGGMTTEGSLIANPGVGSVTCAGCNAGTAQTISMTNGSGSAITFTTSSTADFTLSPSTGTLGAGSTGTITVNHRNVTGDTVTIGGVVYNLVVAVSAGAIASAPQVSDSHGANTLSQDAENLFAAITNMTSACSAGQPVCYTPFQVTWTNEGPSTNTGQANVGAPTGTSGIVIDNYGTGAGEASIYFGTLAGTGTTNAGVKMTQSGLQ